jgi:hypothetical protein
MHLNVLPVVVNKLQRSSSGRPVYAESHWQASVVGWMKLTRVHLRAHDHSVSYCTGSRLTYFVPALMATIKEASNVVIREALIKGGRTGEDLDITVYASQPLPQIDMGLRGKYLAVTLH